MLGQTLAVLVLLAWFCKWLWSRRNFYVLAWKMPGPIGLPIVGSALPLLYEGKCFNEISVFCIVCVLMKFTILKKIFSC